MLFSLLALTLSFTAFAQTQQYTDSGESDPEAEAILNKVRQMYEGYTSLEADFVLEIELPEQPKEVQEGQLARSGTKFRMNMGTQEAFSDGQALYVVLHGNQSVQINDLPDPSEDTGLLTPESIFTFYKNGQFIYTLMDTRSEGNRVCHYIEFKPTDRYSEYSKIRMVIDRKTNEVVRVKAFAKDGSRYTFKIDELNANKQFSSGYFAFSESKYPGYYVEDLRE